MRQYWRPQHTLPPCLIYLLPGMGLCVHVNTTALLSYLPTFIPFPTGAFFGWTTNILGRCLPHLFSHAPLSPPHANRDAYRWWTCWKVRLRAILLYMCCCTYALLPGSCAFFHRIATCMPLLSRFVSYSTLFLCPNFVLVAHA